MRWQASRANRQAYSRRALSVWILSAVAATVGLCWAYTAKRGEP